MKPRIQIALASALLLLGAIAATADKGGDQKNEVRMRTRLAGAAIQGKTPEGNADFRSDSRSRTRLNVEVENVNLAAGTILTVVVQDGTTKTTVGTIKLSSFGGGELELNSDDGDAVPAVQKGDMVTVSNAGATILAGVF
jgi:hypothetical protein